MKIQGLQILTEKLVEKGFLLETRPPTQRRAGRETEIEIGNTSPLEGDTIVLESSPAHYVECIKQNRFSWLLFDGSLLQILYRLRSQNVTFHRYCYIPAPFDIDLRAFSGGEYLDIIEAAGGGNVFEAARRTSFRFDFDPSAQTNQHPAAHVHLNSPACRIPMRGPLSVKEFISFLVRFFYSGVFLPELCGDTLFANATTITELEEGGFHLNWQQQIPNLRR